MWHKYARSADALFRRNYIHVCLITTTFSLECSKVCVVHFVVVISKEE